MSDRDHDEPIFRNEETLQRRAWIERALAGVRDRLRPHELGGPGPAASVPVEPEEPASNAATVRPRLYLVRKADRG